VDRNKRSLHTRVPYNTAYVSTQAKWPMLRCPPEWLVIRLHWKFHWFPWGYFFSQ